MPCRVILMGLRGSGKSSLAHALVRAGVVPRAIDLDALTAARLHAKTAGEALASAGLVAFRQAEAEALRDVLGSAAGSAGGVALALGGGTPTAPGAADLLTQAKRVGSVLVYLRATPGTLRDRLMRVEPGGAAARPSLTGKGTLEEIEEIFAQRDGLYRTLASTVIEVDGLTLEAACDRVRELLD